MTYEYQTPIMLKESMTQNPLVVLALSLVVAVFGFMKLNSIITSIEQTTPVRLYHNQETVANSNMVYRASCHNLGSGTYIWQGCGNFSATVTYSNGSTRSINSCDDLFLSNPKIRFDQSTTNRIVRRMFSGDISRYAHPIFFIDYGGFSGFFRSGFRDKWVLTEGKRFQLNGDKDRVCMYFDRGDFRDKFSGKFSWYVEQIP